jgi:predicted aspartyl protease
MTVSFVYDSSYDPAMPVALIGLSRSGQAEPTVQLTAWLDSGADATMIPLDILQAAGARYMERRRLRGVVGDAVEVRVYLTAVHIGQHSLHGIQVVGMPRGSEALVGRDVLNQLQVNLDGPGLAVTITD